MCQILTESASLVRAIEDERSRYRTVVPVHHLQPRHPRELGHVTRDQCSTIAQRGRCDEQIVRADGLSRRLETRTQGRRDLSTRLVEIEHLDDVRMAQLRERGMELSFAD